MGRSFLLCVLLYCLFAALPSPFIGTALATVTPQVDHVSSAPSPLPAQNSRHTSSARLVKDTTESSEPTQPPAADTLSPAVKTFIGVLIVLLASAMDAIGLNLQRSDHLRNAALPESAQRHELKRPIFLFGMFLYLASQIAGSGCGLIFLHPTAVAPLGAATLIFNVIFARVFLGQIITRRHQLGTLVIIVGAVLIAYFGYMNDEALPIQPRRTAFIIGFVTEDVLVLIAFSLLRYMSYVDFSRPAFLAVHFLRMGEEKTKRIAGALYAFLGGVVASQTIICAKTGVDALLMFLRGQERSNAQEENVVICMLLLTGAFQVYCLQYALKLTTPVIVVPIFFAMYTTLCFLNGALFKDTWLLYQMHQYLLFFVGVVILIIGIYFITQDRDTTFQRSNSEDNYFRSSNDAVDQLPKSREEEEGGRRPWHQERAHRKVAHYSDMPTGLTDVSSSDEDNKSTGAPSAGPSGRRHRQRTEEEEGHHRRHTYRHGSFSNLPMPSFLRSPFGKKKSKETVEEEDQHHLDHISAPPLHPHASTWSASTDSSQSNMATSATELLP